MCSEDSTKITEKEAGDEPFEKSVKFFILIHALLKSITQQ